MDLNKSSIFFVIIVKLSPWILCTSQIRSDFRSEEERGVCLYFVSFVLIVIVIVKLSPWILCTSQLILTSGVKRRESFCILFLNFNIVLNP